MNALEEHLTRARATRRRRGIERAHRSPASGLVDLVSNDYLGLTRHPQVRAAARDAVDSHGTSTAGSRVVNGNLSLHDDLDHALQELIGTPACVTTSTGYAANLAALTALVAPGACIVLDAHAHASLVDGARLSGCPVYWAQHHDVDDVARLLHHHGRPGSLVVVESVYSALGDAAPLADYARLCCEADATLIVDDAHGLGVLGDGRGGAAAAQIAGWENIVITGALGKACASQGGFVAASTPIVEHLIAQARPCIYDTGLAPSSTAAALAAVRLIADEPDRVARLHEHTRTLADALGVAAPPGGILSVPIGAESAGTILDEAAAAGLAVGLFKPGSTPDAAFRLRLTAHADLTPADLDRATAWLNTVHPAVERPEARS